MRKYDDIFFVFFNIVLRTWVHIHFIIFAGSHYSWHRTLTSPPVQGPTLLFTLLSPSSSPFSSPFFSPFSLPFFSPFLSPSFHPSSHPSLCPSSHPSLCPSSHPSLHPSSHPSLHPSSHPSLCPSFHLFFSIILSWSILFHQLPHSVLLFHNI